MSDWKIFAVEIGLGIDQHGQDPTVASMRAVEDAIRRVCLPYLASYLKEGRVKVTVEIGVPASTKVNTELVASKIPLQGVEKEVIVYEGGLRARGIMMPEYGDKSDEIYVAVAAITISIRG